MARRKRQDLQKAEWCRGETSAHPQMPLCEHTLWDLGASLVWISNGFTCHRSYSGSCGAAHPGKDPEGSQLPLLILHKTFRRFSTRPLAAPLLYQTPTLQPCPRLSAFSPRWSTANTAATHPSLRTCPQGNQLTRPFFPPSAFSPHVVLGCFFISPLLLSKQPWNS